MNINIKDSMIIFETDYFSKYALVYDNSKPDENSNISDNTLNNNVKDKANLKIGFKK